MSRQNEPAVAAAMRDSPEFDLVRAIAAQLGDRARGLGDDAAVLALPHGDDCVVSVDSSVDGVHFRRGWLTAREIGYRAAAAAVSDLAAMAAQPRALLLALGIPDEWRSEVAELAEGVGLLAASVGAAVVGGNVSAAGELSLTITVIGSVHAPLRRTGIRADDRLYVTGRLGGPAQALEALLAGREPDAEARARMAKPQPRVREALWLAANGAVAAIDVSDGLLADAEHLAAASNVRIVLDGSCLPRFGEVDAPVAASSGEEYELLVAARADIDTAAFASRFGVPLTQVGVAAEGTAGVTARGLSRVAKGPGHDHFSA